MQYTRMISNIQFATRYTQKQAEFQVNLLHKRGSQKAKAIKVKGENSFYWVIALDYVACNDGEVIFVQQCA
jgi:hypothetical protein